MQLSKSCVRESAPWVQIPPGPPVKKPHVCGVSLFCAQVGVHEGDGPTPPGNASHCWMRWGVKSFLPTAPTGTSPPVPVYAEIMSSDSPLSYRSKRSILSAYSTNSFLSIGSVNSAFSIGSIGSFGSILSIGSFLSILGILSSLTVLGLMAGRKKKSV